MVASISDRRGNRLGAGEGVLGMEVSRTNFHSDSECQLRGPASAARSQCPTPSKAQAGLSAAPRAHSPLLFSGLRRQVGQENRSPVGPRALASRTPQRRLPFKPGKTLLAEGSHSMSLSLFQVPSLPAFLPALPPAAPDLLSACLRGTRTSSIPMGNLTRSGGTLRRPRPVLLQPQKRSAPPPPLLPLMVLP